jgi:hypothetical protein
VPWRSEHLLPCVRLGSQIQFLKKIVKSLADPEGRDVGTSPPQLSSKQGKNNILRKKNPSPWKIKNKTKLIIVDPLLFENPWVHLYTYVHAFSLAELSFVPLSYTSAMGYLQDS